MLAQITNGLSSHRSRHGLWVLPLVIGLAGIAGLVATTDNFLSPQNLFNLTAQAAALLLVSIGQMLVVLVRGLDLSVGAVMSLTTSIVSLDASPWATIPGALAAAVLVGLVNGVTVVRLNVHPIIATLSVASIVQGAALFIRPVAGGTPPEIVITLVRSEVLGVPMPVLWVVLAVALGWKLVHGSRFGLHLFAIGGGDTAHSFGVPVRRNTVLAFVACSVFAALAGLFLAGRIASGDPSIGNQYAVDSITAVALGGTQLAGGVGSLQGTVIGTLLLALLANGMNLLNLSPFVQTAVKGAILLAVISIQPRKRIGL